MTPASARPRDDRGRLVSGDAPRDERRAIVAERRRRVPPRPSRSGSARAISAARSNAHSGIACDRGPQADGVRARREVRDRIAPRRASARTSRPARTSCCDEVARAGRRGAAPGSATTSAPVPSGPQSHFWPGDGVEVESRRVDRHRADRLRAVDEDREAGRRAELVHGKHLPRRPEDVGEREQPRARRDGGDDPLGIGLDDDDLRARRVQRPDQPEVLVGRRDDLVAPRRGRARRERCCSRPSSTPSARPARRRRRRARRPRRGAPPARRGAARTARSSRAPSRRPAPRRRASRRSSRVRAGPTLPACRYA